MMTATEVWDEAVAAALIAGVQLLGDDLLIGLYVNVPVISKTTKLADLVEATYPGYTRQSTTGGVIIRDPDNGIVVMFEGQIWQQVGTPVPVTINGIFGLAGVTPALAFIEAFSTPISLNDDFDAFQTVLQYYESNPSQGTSAIVR